MQQDDKKAPVSSAAPRVISISKLGHTWFIDIDGTILAHNSHLHGGDVLLPGVRKFWEKIPSCDRIVLLTARRRCHRTNTLQFISEAGLRFDEVIFDLPVGERILVNDAKPSGMNTAIAVTVLRDAGLEDLEVSIDEAM